MIAPTSHRAALDLGRFAAAGGIVVTHAMAAPRDWVGHLSLALFLVLTAFLAGQSFRRAEAYPLAPRLRRLLLPWIVWCAFYWLVDFDVSDREQLFVLPSDPWSILAGPSIHLWFLPFVALAGLAVAPLGRFVSNPGRGGHRTLGAVLLAMLGLTLGAMVLSGSDPRVAMGALSILVFLVLWHLPLGIAIAPSAQTLGRDAFGIYLMHPFFLLVIYKFLGPNLGWPADAALAFVMSWAGTAILRRLPYGDRIA